MIHTLESAETNLTIMTLNSLNDRKNDDRTNVETDALNHVYVQKKQGTSLTSVRKGT